MLYTLKTLACVILAMLSLFLVGCALDRSDPRTVAEVSFRAILAKDYPQLQQLVGCGAVIPDEQAWRDAAFIRDRLADERIKRAWMKGSIGGYALSEVMMEDFQGPRFLPERLVQVRFSLSGKSYLATFPITLCDNRWSPGMNPSVGDFFIRFEEVGEEASQGWVSRGAARAAAALCVCLGRTEARTARLMK